MFNEAVILTLLNHSSRHPVLFSLQAKGAERPKSGHV